MTPKQLKAENEELRYQVNLFRAAFTTRLMPCGHPSAFTVEEAPREFVCLYCQLAALQAEVKAGDEMNVSLEEIRDINYQWQAQVDELQAQLAALSWARWVTDGSLPKMNELVLVMLEFHPWWDFASYMQVGTRTYWDGRSGYPLSPVYWMRLPPPPEER